MFDTDLLVKLVYGKSPIESIFSYVIENNSGIINMNEISSSYERLEDNISKFEEWLYEVWGLEFYKSMIKEHEDWALNKAFRIAKEKEANILVCDGLSIRELIVAKKALDERIDYVMGYSPHPTDTNAVATSIFGTSSLEAAFRGGSRLIEGYEWNTEIIKDIINPPRIGGRKDLALLTYYPDAPLHNAVKYGIAKVQDISNVITSLIVLVKQLSLTNNLVLTGDHGYLFLGNNPIRYLWRWVRRAYRHGGTYGKNELEFKGEKMAVGRFHAPDVRRSGAFITHGGVSLTESLVPIVIVKGGE